MIWRYRSTAAPLALAFAALLPVATGCMSSSDAAVETRVRVTMDDFGFETDRAVVPAGLVDLRVHNDGPSTHEINVDRTIYRSGKIPLQPDGITADEEAPHLRRIDSIEQVNLGATADLVVRLKPGKYVLWCNLEGHYLGGMHKLLKVR